MNGVKTDSALIWSDRWRLGALTRTELMNIGFASVIIGFLFILFHLLGSTVENVGRSSAFRRRWKNRQT